MLMRSIRKKPIHDIPAVCSAADVKMGCTEDQIIAAPALPDSGVNIQFT
jgi:hypothetical protein